MSGNTVLAVIAIIVVWMLVGAVLGVAIGTLFHRRY